VLEDGSVVRVSPSTGAVRDRIAVPGAASLAAGTGGIWVSGSGSVRRLDPVTGALGHPLRLGGRGAAVATTGDAVWLVLRAGGTLVRITG
jgi:hypothetical protein